jgi:cytochrome c oxidase subunit 1
VHFWGSLVAMNGIFLPMLFQGLAGINRRMYDAGRTYSEFAGFEWTFSLQACAAGVLGLAQIVFIVNLLWSLGRGSRVGDNPWEATTLEWATGSPPPFHNFTTPPVVRRGPYDYSVPGSTRDYLPQNEA